MKNKTFKIISLIAATALALCSFAFAACKDGQASNGDPDAKDDNSASDGWLNFTHNYTDKDGESATLEYALYVPSAYTDGVKLPLVTYIPDSSLVGYSLSTIKRQTCIVNWASSDNMSENPAFFLIFAFKENSSDVYTEGSQGSQIVPIINKVVAEYGMDEDRLYLTGQSMGGITDFALNDEYPEMFAATVYVGCQPGNEVGDELYDALIESAAFADQKFIYITSRLDGKAPYGQDAVEEVLVSRGIEYGKLYGLDHTDGEALNEAVKDVLKEEIGRAHV